VSRPTQSHARPGDEGGIDFSEVHITAKPDLEGPWNQRAFKDVLAKVAASRSVAYLLVSDGRSEKCVFFPTGGIRLTSVGRRKGISLRKAMTTHPHFTPEMAQELAKARVRTGKSLEDSLAGPLRKIAQQCSQIIVFDELVDMALWDGAEFEYRDANPPPAIFDPRLEAVKMSLGVKKMLGEVQEKTKAWRQLQQKIGTPARSVVRSGGRALKVKGVPGAIIAKARKAGSDGVLLEEVILAGRLAGANAIDVCRHIEALSSQDALRIDAQPPALTPQRKKKRAQGRIDELEKALQLMINRLVAHRKLAADCMEVGKQDEAIGHLQIVGEELERRHDAEGAVKLYREILGVAPQAFFAREQIARLFEGMKKGPEAVREWLALARGYAGVRLFNRASERLRRALKLEPKNGNLRRFLIDSLLSLGKKKEAVGEYERLAEDYEAEGRADEALACFQEIVELDPGHAEANRRLANAARGRGGVARPLIGFVVGLALVAGLALFVTSRYEVLQAFKVARQDSLDQARAKKFSDAHRTLETFAVDHDFEGPRLARTRNAISTLEGLEAQALFVSAGELEAAGNITEARKGYTRLQTVFSETVWADKARERLQGLEDKMIKAMTLAEEIAGLLEEKQGESAFKKCQLLFRQYPWTSAARATELSLRVETTPGQATLEVNGERAKGVTPTAVTHVGPEPFTLKVTHPGYRPVSQTVDLAGAKAHYPLTIELERETRWEAPTLGPLTLALASSATSIPVPGSDQRLYSLTHTGETRWAHALDLFTELSGSALVGKSVVAFALDTGRVTGLSSKTGKVLWTRRVKGKGLRSVGALPKLDAALFVNDEHVFALSFKSGKSYWKVKLPGRLAAPMLVDEEKGRVLGATVNGRLAIIEVRKGKLFQLRVDGRPVGGPVPVPGGCLVSTEDGALTLLWRKVLWSQKLEVPSTVAPATSEGMAYVPSGASLIALSLKDGSEAWRVDLDAPVNAPVHLDGRVYVTTQSGRAYCLLASTGKLRWAFSTGGPVTAPPLVTVSGTVLVASADYTVYAISDD
jgi:outer membrane protein assembly factor BamB/tetratricopeptide (TPR) repeat protein